MGRFILSVFFWIVTSIIYAGISTILFHFANSVFARMNNQRFWNMAISNEKPIYLPYTHYKVDAYHVAQTLGLLCIVFVAYFHKPLTDKWYDIPLELVIYWLTWILPFNLFYNKVFLNSETNSINHLFIQKSKVMFKNFGWKQVVLLAFFVLIAAGVIIMATAKIVPGFDTGDHQRTVGGWITGIGVVGCIGWFVYLYVTSNSEKGNNIYK